MGVGGAEMAPHVHRGIRVGAVAVLGSGLADVCVRSERSGSVAVGEG